MLSRGHRLVQVLCAVVAVSAMALPTCGTPIHSGNANQLQKIADLPVSHGVVKTIWLSPDGAAMITGNVDGEILIWDTQTWAYTVFQPQQQELTLYQASVEKTQIANVCAVSPDGGFVAASGAGAEGTVVVRDRAGQEVMTFVFGAPVYCMEFSPDGTLLAVGGLRTTIHLVDVATWTMRGDLTGSHEYVSNLLFTPDGSTLVASYERPANVIKTWDLATLGETGSFTHVTTRIDYHALVLAPNGQDLVLATTEEEEIHFIGLVTHAVTKAWNRDPNAPYELAFSSDGSLLVSASDRLLLWDAAGGVVLRAIASMSTEAGTVVFSPDGARLYLSVWEEGIQVWGIAP